ncbi:MAG: RES family NAD+ phosphorylase [Rhodanobacteraceae bacterium]
MTKAHIAWRIGTTTMTCTADDLSGAGAAQNPGRWNASNQFVVYAAPTIAMSVLETAAHLRSGSLPLDRHVVRIAIPAGVWRARERVPVSRLPVGWDAMPASMIAAQFGAKWYDARRGAILEVPSAIVPEETILVINAMHPDAGKLQADAVRRSEFERLFRR